MKILLLTDGITPYVLGGMQRHSYFLARYLVPSGHDVMLYHCVSNRDELPFDNEVFLEIFNDITEDQQNDWKKRFKSKCFNFPKLDNMPGHYLRESFRYSELIFEDIKSHLGEYDFIYAKGFSAWRLLREKKRGIKCPPIGVKFHGMNMFQYTPSLKGKLENYMFRNPARYNMKMADYIFSYGGKITEIILAQGINKNKIIEIPTGIMNSWIKETPNFKESYDKIKFLFVGRYDKVKGIKELYSAIEKIPKDKAEFHFVGPFEKQNQIKAGNVFYYGKLSDEKELQKIYDSCDALICPSHSEGMPNAVIEAMSRGLLILATDTGAMSILVKNDINGYLIKKSSVNNIRKSIDSVLNLDTNQINDMKQKSLNLAKTKLGWGNIADQLTEQLNKIIVKNSP